MLLFESKKDINRQPQISMLYISNQKVESILRNKGNKLYKNTHGTVFKRKTNNKRRKKNALLKKNSKLARAPVAPATPI